MVTKTKIVTVALVLAIAFLGFYFSQSTEKIDPSQKEVKVGALFPLSGLVGNIGIEAQRGLELAVEEINKNSKYKISLVFEDTEFPNPEKSVSATHKLLEIDNVDIVLSSIIEDIKPAMKLYEEKKVPIVAIWDSNKELENSGNYIFSTGFSTEEAGKTMADFASQKLNINKIYIISHIDAWSEIIQESFSNRIKENRGEIIEAKSVEVGEQDFRTLILDAKQRKADAIYAPLVPVNSELFVKQAKELGFKGYILMGDGLIQDTIDASGEASEGIYFTAIYSPESQEMEKLKTYYKEKYAAEPTDPAVLSLAYDIVFVVSEAIEIADSTDSQKVANALYKIKNFKGASGEISINENGGSERKEKVFVVKDMKPVLVE